MEPSSELASDGVKEPRPRAVDRNRLHVTSRDPVMVATAKSSRPARSAGASRAPAPAKTAPDPEISVPDTHAPAFKSEAHRESLAVATRRMPGTTRCLSMPCQTGTRNQTRRRTGRSPEARITRASHVLSSWSRTTASTEQIRSRTALFTTDPTEAPLFRLPVEPSARNGLRTACRMIVDKIPRSRNRRCARSAGSMMRISAAQSGHSRFLGLAACPGLTKP